MLKVRQSLLLALLLAVGAPLAADDPPPPPAPPDLKVKAAPLDPKRVNEAIDRGVAWLVDHYAKRPLGKGAREKELVVLTALHGGLSPAHPLIAKVLPIILEEAPRDTYNVALAAMLLHRLDAKKYQMKIAQCASFFVQSQCKNGQWAYSGKPGPVPKPGDYPVFERDAPYLVYDFEAKDGKKGDSSDEPVVMRKMKGLKIPPQVKSFIECGDNSNMQYAILGLRAAAESGCLIPDETWKRALDFIHKTREADGGFGYNPDWPAKATHTMTTAGISMAAICNFYLKRELAEDPVLKDMLAWLEKPFQVAWSTSVFNPPFMNNPDGLSCHYYYLYGLERVCALTDSPRLGTHDWYAEGANWLLAQQKPDGSWKDPKAAPLVSQAELDTCFAILFLRRATIPLIPEVKRLYEVGEKDKTEQKPKDKP